MHKQNQAARWIGLFIISLSLNGCFYAVQIGDTLHVAAASNLARLFPTLAAACKKSTGITLIPSLGGTAQLAQQIDNGGPFDLFLAADVSHVAALDASHKLVPNSMHNYAQGRLVLFAPRRTDINSISDLKLSSVKKIGVAQPDLAPYGKATVEALTKAGVWKQVESKIVYGQNISAVLQFVDSSNVDCSFTALALVYDNPGHKLPIDPALHAPIDQALGIPAGTAHPAEAAKVAAWFVSQEARSIFTAAGYGIAAQDPDGAPAGGPSTLKP